MENCCWVGRGQVFKIQFRKPSGGTVEGLGVESVPVEGAEEEMVEVHVQVEEAELQQDMLIVEEEKDDMQVGQGIYRVQICSCCNLWPCAFLFLEHKRMIGGGRWHHSIYCKN